MYVIVKSLPPVLYGKYSTRHEAEMANIARGKAECYISIEAECFILSIAHGVGGSKGKVGIQI